MKTIKYKQYLPDGTIHYWGFIKDHFIAPYLNTNIKDALKDSKQFIGLHDKNGVEIYEGDILEYLNGDKFEVEYMSPWAGYHPFATTYLEGNVTMRGIDTEVIGNINENPELSVTNSK